MWVVSVLRAMTLPSAALIALGALGALVAFAGCGGDGPTGTPPPPPPPVVSRDSLVESAPLGEATLSGAFDVVREAGDWSVALEGSPGLEFEVFRIVIRAGGHTAWHTHVGPRFIQVLQGTLKSYDSDDPSCTPIVRTAGQAYFDFHFDDPHILRNESATEQLEFLTVALHPPGNEEVGTDFPSPGNCPF